MLGLRDGYVLTQDRQAEPGRYTIFVYSQEKRTFTMIDGQTLERNGRATLKLALPRDYGRCRVVRGPTGLEQLEVVHVERNHPIESQAMQRLLKEAAEIAAPALPASAAAKTCSATPGQPWPAINDRLMVAGNTLVLRECHEPTLQVRERLVRRVRRVHDM